MGCQQFYGDLCRSLNLGATDVDIGPVFQGRHSYLTSLCALESPSVMIEEFDCWFIRFNHYL